MKFSESLKKNRDFQYVYKNGKSYANKCLVMYIIPNEQNKNRVGISVSKKVGNSVVIARTSAKEKSYHEIENALIHLGKLHHIYI